MKYAINNNGSISIYCGNIVPAGAIALNNEQFEGIISKRLTLDGGIIVSVNNTDETDIKKQYHESLLLLEETKTKTGLNGLSVKRAEDLIDALYAEADTTAKSITVTKQIVKKMLPFILKSA